MQTMIDQVSIHHEVVGDGKPILFVHGFPLSGLMWRPTVERLGGWKCVVPDLRGHGQSGASERVTIKRFTDDLVALLDAIGERRPVVVCGLSMGGVVAFDYFRRYRERLRALILTDCRANAETPKGAMQREKLAQAVLRNGSVVAADTMVDKLFARGADAALRRSWHEIMAATPPMGVAAAARALALRPDSRPTLAEIDVPTLLVFGEEDEITPPELARDMHGAIRGSRLAIIPGAGHLPPVEQPDRYADTLQAFLKTLPAPGG